MRTKIQRGQQRAAQPARHAPHTPGARLPNSALLDNIQAPVTPQELEALPSREHAPTEQLGEQIQARLGVALEGLHIYEDEGLEQFSQRAYARGNEIHVAKGEYDPHSQSGRELLLHEAAHVVQQGSSMARGSGILESPALEAQADAGFEAPASFSMPTGAQGAPVQGWNPFRRKKKEEAEPAAASAPVADVAAQTGDAAALQAAAAGAGQAEPEHQADGGAQQQAAQPSRWQRFKSSAGRHLSNAGTILSHPFKKAGQAIGGFASRTKDKIKENWPGFKSEAGRLASNAGTILSYPLNALFMNPLKKAGVAIGGAASGVASSMKRKHQRAVDHLNNNRQDYNDMSRFERFKWTMKNPLARMFAAREKGGTEARALRQEKLDARTAQLREEMHYDQQLGDAAYDPAADPHLAPAGPAGSPAGPAGNVANGALALAGGEAAIPGKDETLGDTGNMVKNDVLLGKPALAPTGAALGLGLGSRTAQSIQASNNELGAAYDNLNKLTPGSPEYLEAEEEITKLQQATQLTDAQRGFGIASGVFGAGAAGMAFAGNAMSVKDQVKKGNTADAVAHGSLAFGNALDFAGNVAKIGAYATPGTDALSMIGGNLIPAVGIGVGATQMAAGGIRLASATRTRTKMGNRIESMKAAQEAGTLNEDQSRMYKTFEMAHRMAKIRQAEGGMEMVQGALGATGNALTLGGVTAPVGAIVSGGGAVVGAAKGIVSGKMRKSLRTDTVEEELHLNDKIQALVDEGYDAREAKHMVLQSMGFSTGKRKEAFEHIAMRRATKLHKRANSTKTTDKALRKKEEAQTILDEMGLSRVDGEYSLQGIAEKIGMDNTTSWQSQMRDTKASRTANPFKAAAEENRKKKTLDKLNSLAK